MKLNLNRLALVLFFTAASCVAGASQTTGDRNATAPVAPQQAAAAATTEPRSGTSVDETFELNITERRITERGFASSLAVEVGEDTARGLRLRVGVGISADEINVLLKNVRGRVRFRATAERVLARLNARRPPDPVP